MFSDVLRAATQILEILDRTALAKLRELKNKIENGNPGIRSCDLATSTWRNIREGVRGEQRSNCENWP